MRYSQLEKSWMDSRISHELVTLLTYQVAKIVTPTTGTRRQKPSRTIASPHIMTSETTIPPLHEFIDILSRRSNSHTGTLLVALILLTRLSQRLGHVTTGMASAPQRIFLASLIISTKLIHDTSPKNKHWLSFSNDYFELDEINLMEKQFLTLMDFNLSITIDDFQQAVDRYKQLQKDGRRNNKNNNYKKKEWQDTPDCLVAPGRNVALAAGKNATLTRPYTSLSASTSASSLASASSSSSLSSVSLSHHTPPIFDALSNSSSTSTLQSHSSTCMAIGGYMETIPLNDSDATCDDVGMKRCYSTNYVLSPLYSVQ